MRRRRPGRDLGGAGSLLQSPKPAASENASEDVNVSSGFQVLPALPMSRGLLYLPMWRCIIGCGCLSSRSPMR